MSARMRVTPTPTIQFIRGDCLHHLAQLPDQCVDSFVTDPPYGIDLKLRWNRAAGLSIRNDSLAKARALWAAFLPHAQRIAKPNTAHLFFGTWKSTWIRDLLAEHFQIKGCIVWYKNTWGLGAHLRPRWELLWLCHKGKPPIPDPAPPDVWEHARDHRLRHPCQKPVDLLRRAVRLVCPEQGLVCDPFAGIASTGVAAVEEGRSFIGMELTPKYHRLGQSRLRQALLDPSNHANTARKAKRARALRAFLPRPDKRA